MFARNKNILKGFVLTKVDCERFLPFLSYGFCDI